MKSERGTSEDMTNSGTDKIVIQSAHVIESDGYQGNVSENKEELKNSLVEWLLK